MRDGTRVILIGLGDRAAFDGERARVAAAVAHGRAREIGTQTLCWEVPHHVSDDVVAGLVQGTLLHAYRFERYKPSEDSRRVGRLLLSAHHDVSEPVRVAAILAGAQNRARDLGNIPANDLPPAALAAYAEEMAGQPRADVCRRSRRTRSARPAWAPSPRSPRAPISPPG